MSNYLLVGTRKGLMSLERNAGGGWKLLRTAHLGMPVPYAMRDPRSGDLWASLDHGHWGAKLRRSRDDGQSWEEIEPPAYPEGAEVNDGELASLDYLWIIAPGGDDQPGTLYIGTEPGGLFRSDDGGNAWSLVESLWNHPSRPGGWFGGGRDGPGIHSIIVDPRDSHQVRLGISCAGVFETTDGGESWNPRNSGLVADFLPDPSSEIGQDPHCLVQCRDQPDVLWQQNHCGIFRSTDCGANWSQVSVKGEVAHFGFPIVVDPTNGDNAWVVPAISDEIRIAIDGALCVSRTTDGGASWTELRTGLPQEACYDLIFRHAFDLGGDALAFGSTTGNLFVSEDRGDSWACVASHLPPIYSVRWV
ncbi:hypothetical protein JYT15_00815 [Acidimicrobium ferrooxidans]|nr:hypothetical protein [Acidimicrobium ferrooxidans]